MNLAAVVDSPAPGSTHYRQRIPVEGWIHADYRHSQLKRISAHAPAPHGEIGATTHLYLRSDVIDALKLAPDIRTGFRFVATFAQPPPPTSPTPAVAIELRAEFADGTVLPFTSVAFQVFARDFTTAAYGNLCNPQQTGLLHRDQLYAPTAPAASADPECIKLLDHYLAPGASVVEIGCGVGAFHEPLKKLNHAWVGCEADLDSLHALALHSRPHRQIKGSSLPFLRSRYRLPAADREFDAALAVNLLERVRDPAPVLREIARVTRKQAFFSVHNCETLPFLADRLAAPWHFLARDRLNFFTRHNLQPLLVRHFRSVEILDYGRQPLASPDGLPLPYHLFAHCEV